MSTHTGSNLHTTDFAPFLPARADRPAELHLVNLELQPGQPSAKDSVIACVFMLGYLAIYLAVGFAALGVVTRVWAAIFG